MNRLRHHHNIFNRPQVGSHPCLHGWRGIDAAVNLAAVVDHEIEADRTHVVLQLRANESPDFIDFQAGASAIAHHVALILAGVNYPDRPATIILAGGGGGNLG